MLIVEWIALLFGVISAVLTIRARVSCWWTGIISLLGFVYILGSKRVYGDMCIQIFFILQSIQGWWKWHKANKDDSLPITYLGSLYIYPQITAWLVVMWILYRIGGSIPMFDAGLVIFSVMANTLCVYKKIENWYYWILIDVLHIGMFSYQGLYTSALTYALFLIIAIFGLREWNRSTEDDGQNYLA